MQGHHRVVIPTSVFQRARQRQLNLHLVFDSRIGQFGERRLHQGDVVAGQSNRLQVGKAPPRGPGGRMQGDSGSKRARGEFDVAIRLCQIPPDDL